MGQRPPSRLGLSGMWVDARDCVGQQGWHIWYGERGILVESPCCSDPDPGVAIHHWAQDVARAPAVAGRFAH
eukprot:13181844-Heterocapsa_arctica.AAC.1